MYVVRRHKLLRRLLLELLAELRSIHGEHVAHLRDVGSLLASRAVYAPLILYKQVWHYPPSQSYAQQAAW